ncbi:protein UL27 [Mandrillus leucophaeus cytomegalovirus]|uniref:Protein UL27 n=1 Tax=Mandrillus leucophaeus cytomegalovirus TaxID=1654930 RepID=A0A0G2UPG0_9BETA|nr:protein UL27 [Mandrillus leucophaeus cytomegalovirus]AKI29791.1 protein UL27 [Mandrillus leucophaeus cytomegalovirus]
MATAGVIAEDLYSDPRTAFEFVEDCPDDDFCYNFMRTYLTPVRDRRQAVLMGLCRMSGPKKSKKRAMGSQQRSKNKSPIVYVRRSFLANSAFATAHGKYNIRGLCLQADLTVWGLLRGVPSKPEPGSFCWMNVSQFRHIVGAGPFLPEISKSAKRIAVAVATGQYAVCTLLNYKVFGTKTHYVRQLCVLTDELFRRLSGTMCLFLNPDERELIDKCSPLSICKKLSLNYRAQKNAVFFHPRFHVRAEEALKALYAKFCTCGDCHESSCLTNGSDAAAEPLRPRLEDAELRLLNNTQLGRFHLPAIRHLSAAEQLRVQQSVARDLGFTDWSNTLVDDYFLLPVGMSCGTPCQGYAMYLMSNAVLALKVIRLLYITVRHEQNACVRALCKDVNCLIKMFRCESFSIRKGLAQNAAQRMEVSRFRRHVQDLKQIKFTVETFVETFCEFIKIVNKIPDYQYISIHVKRELVLLHLLKLRRVYESSSPETRRAERLAWYYLRHGDVTLDPGLLMTFNSILADCELSNNANRCRRKAPLVIPATATVTVRYQGHLEKLSRLHVRRFRPHEVGGCAI